MSQGPNYLFSLFSILAMRITLFQQDIKWLDPLANYAKIEAVLADHPDTDLLVLPEMCSTGFVTCPRLNDIEQVAEVELRMSALASRYQTALCGSFAVSLPDGTNRNRCYFFTPEGENYFADKHHLFSIGGEHLGYQAGQERVVAEWRGIRFLLLVCYDLRFPVWSRITDESAYDIIVCVANWPQQRRLAWDTLLSARAIENQSYVIGVNRVGKDMVCPYDGGTRAIHPYGHIVAQCEDGVESVCTFVPDMQKLGDFRRKFPSSMDADRFCIVR